MCMLQCNLFCSCVNKTLIDNKSISACPSKHSTVVVISSTATNDSTILKTSDAQVPSVAELTLANDPVLITTAKSLSYAQLFAIDAPAGMLHTL